jgi:hypothetical protein
MGFEGEVAEGLGLREMLPGSWSWLDAGGGCFTGAVGTGVIRAEERFDMRGHLAIDRQRAHGSGGDWTGGLDEGGPWLRERGGRVGQRALFLGVPVNQRSVRPQTTIRATQALWRVEGAVLGKVRCFFCGAGVGTIFKARGGRGVSWAGK